jgi:RNA polymerase sigma factor (sigma-70 family)
MPDGQQVLGSQDNPAARERLRMWMDAMRANYDLVQAGIVGLIDAANKYDAEKQNSFPTCAKHRIRGAILDNLRKLDWASRDMRRQKLVAAAVKDLTAILGTDSFGDRDCG